jgi:hypothetical protein
MAAEIKYRVKFLKVAALPVGNFQVGEIGSLAPELADELIESEAVELIEIVKVEIPQSVEVPAEEPKELNING